MLFIYFWLLWVSIALRRLSPVALSRASLRCQVQASRCCGLACCRAQALGSRASVVVTHRLSSCDSQAPELGLSSVVSGLSCSSVCGIFLDQGSNLCPLLWQVDSTVPAGKSLEYNWLTMLLLASGIQQKWFSYTYTCILFLKFFSPLLRNSLTVT